MGQRSSIETHYRLGPCHLSAGTWVEVGTQRWKLWQAGHMCSECAQCQPVVLMGHGLQPTLAASLPFPSLSRSSARNAPNARTPSVFKPFGPNALGL